MPRLFLSTSFTSYIDPKTGSIRADSRKAIERIIAALRESEHFTVFCAVEYEDWKVSEEAPEVSIKKDLEEINKADLLVALLPATGSVGGMHFEMGAAYATGKRVFVAVPKNVELSFFNRGAIGAGYIEYINYDNPASLAKNLRLAISQGASRCT